MKGTFGKHLYKSYFAFGLIAIGLALAVVAIILSVHTGSPPPKSPPNVTPLNSAPSSAKLTQRSIDSYNVAPDLPKFISIPSIDIDKVRILRLGVGKDGAIASPSNIYDAGWYSASSKPGQPGAMFVYGHVSNWQANGIFYNLKKLKPNDTIMITRGDGKLFTYRVVTTKMYRYNEVDMNRVLTAIDQNKPGLNLMTCAGQVIKGTSEFTQRLVVFTTLVGVE